MNGDPIQRTIRASLLTAAALCLITGCGRDDAPAAETSGTVSDPKPYETRGTAAGPVAVVSAVTDDILAPRPDRPILARPPKPPILTVDREATPLKIAFISYANPQQVARDIGPVVAYLEPYVGVPIKGFVTLDYGSTIEAMRNDQADLAMIDPLAFMMAHEQMGAEPLLLEIYSSGRPAYHSCIWVRRDSGITTPADLEGKSIAFADQVDMSGHLMPRDVFVKAGLLPATELKGSFFRDVYFAGGDEQAIRAVLNKFVDAAGVSQYATLLLRPDERALVTTIADSIESPSHLVMARKGLSEKLRNRLKQALLSLDPAVAEDKAVLDRLYGVQGYVDAKLADFYPVAQVAARYGFVKDPGLFSNK